jgi:hypothetical protein
MMAVMNIVDGNTLYLVLGIFVLLYFVAVKQKQIFDPVSRRSGERGIW